MLTSSLFLRLSTTLVSVLLLISSPALAAPTHAIYTLDTDFFSGNFYDHFDFFDSADPTHGFVTYVNRSVAENYGPRNQGVPLIQGGDNCPARINVDFTNTFNSSRPYYGINNVGRPSVRIESQQSWTHGLIVVDISHMPGGICGTWPAFWTLGSGGWPHNGEVDIIEGWDDQTTNFASGHVANNCTVQQSNLMTNTVPYADCNWYTGYPEDPNYTGCRTVDSDTRSYGTGFNNIGGGVYAMEWTSEAIKIYFFPRGKIPIDVLSAHPNPAKWGIPKAYIGGSSCNVDQNFYQHRIIFDDTFCGDAADPDFGTCASKLNITNNCAAYVGKNPSVFRGAYWEVNALKVYTTRPTTSNATSTTTKTWSSTTSTSSVTTTKNSTSATTVPWTTMRSRSSTTASSTTMTTLSTTMSVTGSITPWPGSWTSSHPVAKSSSTSSGITSVSSSNASTWTPSSTMPTWTGTWASTYL